MKLTLFIALTFIFLSTKSQTISGKVLDLTTNQPLPETTAYLLDNASVADSLIKDRDNYYFLRFGGHKILNQTQVDSLGKFSFNVANENSYTICVSHPMPYFYMGNNKQDSARGYREDFIYNIHINKRRKFFKEFHLMVTCPYEKTNTQSFCPKCKRTDKVVPIIWGLDIPIFDDNGKSLDKYFEENHLGGCIVDSYCNPTKHCKRCKNDF